MTSDWVYPDDVREWLNDFGGEPAGTGILGTPEQLSLFLRECEWCVNLYLIERAMEKCDPKLARQAFEHCEAVVDCLAAITPECDKPHLEDSNLRSARELLERLVHLLPSTPQAGRPEKTEELNLVGRMANAHIRFFGTMPPKSIKSPFADCVKRTFDCCQIDAQVQNLIYKVVSGKHRNPRWGEHINNPP